MQLRDKIYTCRKRAGLSQEALAAELGVSRQAVSKWETGDAEPELGKLRLLAKAFGVSVDWLLSEEDTPPQAEAAPEAPPAPSWVEAVPGVLGRLLRRYGWLFGVYLAVSGLLFAGIGALARGMAQRMFSGFSGMGGFDMPGMLSDGTVYYDSFGGVMQDPFASMAANNPVAILGTAIIVLGLVMTLAGVVLAVVLKKRKGEG